jgi:hypothetical protein
MYLKGAQPQSGGCQRDLSVRYEKIGNILVTAGKREPPESDKDHVRERLDDARTGGPFIEGWSSDDHLAAFGAYQASCQALRKLGHTDEHRPLQRRIRRLRG